MTRLSLSVALLSALALAGCETANQELDKESAAAIQTVLARAKFEMSCPAATASVLSRNLINPEIQSVGPRGPQGTAHAEYTIGVEGCGQKAVYLSVCQIGSISCVAEAARSPM